MPGAQRGLRPTLLGCPAATFCASPSLIACRRSGYVTLTSLFPISADFSAARYVAWSEVYGTGRLRRFPALRRCPPLLALRGRIRLIRNPLLLRPLEAVLDQRRSVPRQLYPPIAVAIAATAKMPVVCKKRPYDASTKRLQLRSPWLTRRRHANKQQCTPFI